MSDQLAYRCPLQSQCTSGRAEFTSENKSRGKWFTAGVRQQVLSSKDWDSEGKCSSVITLALVLQSNSLPI